MNTNKASLSAGIIFLGAPSGPKNLMIKWSNNYRNDSILWIVVYAGLSSNIQLMNVGILYVRIRKAQITLPKNIL